MRFTEVSIVITCWRVAQNLITCKLLTHTCGVYLEYDLQPLSTMAYALIPYAHGTCVLMKTLMNRIPYVSQLNIY